MGRELIEGEAVELAAGAEEAEASARPMPARSAASGELSPWKGEVRTAALAAAGGIVAGAATVAAVRAGRAIAPGRRTARALRGRGRPAKILASRSFLVDVHMLGSK